MVGAPNPSELGDLRYYKGPVVIKYTIWFSQVHVGSTSGVPRASWEFEPSYP